MKWKGCSGKKLTLIKTNNWHQELTDVDARFLNMLWKEIHVKRNIKLKWTRSAHLEITAVAKLRNWEVENMVSVGVGDRVPLKYKRYWNIAMLLKGEMNCLLERCEFFKLQDFSCFVRRQGTPNVSFDMIIFSYFTECASRLFTNI